MGSAKDLVEVAYSYLGTTEDDPRFAELIDYYNSHTGGYDMRLWDEWCACFVSVCSLKSGNADATGTSVNCADFRNIWAAKGILRSAGSVPEQGWLIDYDWERDGIPDHIGIVVGCDGKTIHVIEGNTDGETCAEHWIPVGDSTISCFGAPEYEAKPEQVPGKAYNNKGLKYRAHVQDIGWCPWVRDGQVAGTTGFSKRLEAITFEPPEGVVLRVKVHQETRGWSTYQDAKHGAPVTVGTTGQSKRLEGICIEAVEMPKGWRLEYRVHVQQYGWLAWTPAGYATGSDGQSRRMEAIQVRMVKSNA